jgi:hypothetical protein
MQERRHTRRMRHRLRKRILFAFAFLGFSAVFYESAQTFQQDQIASTAVTSLAGAPTPISTIVPSKPVTAVEPPQQGPVAVGLAFRINGDPGLRDRYAHIRSLNSGAPVTLPELVTRR